MAFIRLKSQWISVKKIEVDFSWTGEVFFYSNRVVAAVWVGRIPYCQKKRSLNIKEVLS